MNVASKVVTSLTLVVVLVAAACAGDEPNETRGDGQELTDITFSIASAVIHPVVSYFSLGEGAGFFEEEGLEAEFVTAPGGGAEAATALVGPRGDVDFASTIQDVTLNGLAEGNPIPVLCFMNTTQQTIYQVAVLPDSPIQAIEDLRGKKIGVNAFGSASEFYARAVLEDAGINPESEAELVAVEQGAVAGQALKGGEVDALSLWGFTYAEMESRGIVELRRLDQPPFIEGIVTGPFVCTRREMFEDDRELVVGAGRAMAKSMVFFHENPEAALRIHWRMFPETQPADMSIDEALELMVPQAQARAELLVPPEGEGWGYFDEEALRNYVDYLGLDLQMDEVAQYFDNSLIDEINDFDEEAIRQFAREYQQ